MINGMRFREQYLSAFAKNWAWFFAWGLGLIILGLFAIYYSYIATLITVISLGIVIFLGGLIVLFDTFVFWWGKWAGFFLHLIIALLYLFVGYTLFSGPLAGSVSLTLLLGIFYIVVGLFRIFYSATVRLPRRWGWGLFNGIVALLLGVLILEHWPQSSLFIIGLFVGIDLIVEGWTYVMAALGARAIAKSA